MFNSVTPVAVELTDPAGISMYLILAVILYAIRETHVISNRFLPIIAVILGLLIAWLQFGKFDTETLIAGVRMGILGIGSVATIKYFIDNQDKPPKEDDGVIVDEDRNIDKY